MLSLQEITDLKNRVNTTLEIGCLDAIWAMAYEKLATALAGLENLSGVSPKPTTTPETRKKSVEVFLEALEQQGRSDKVVAQVKILCVSYIEKGEPVAITFKEKAIVLADGQVLPMSTEQFNRSKYMRAHILEVIPQEK